MKKFILQMILLILVIGIGIFFASPAGNLRGVDLPFLPRRETLIKLQVNEVTLQVELANTSSERSKGLGGRTSLPDDQGMLFVFTKADKYPFWMKGLKFPLDFIWIKDMQVVDILENVQPPQPGVSDASLPIYTSQVEVDKVLEVNAGVVKKFNIKIGDKVIY